MGVDNIGLGQGTKVPVFAPPGDEGDLFAIGRPDWAVIVPVATGDLYDLASVEVSDEQVIVGIAPPALQVVAVADAVDLDDPRALDLAAGRSARRRFGVCAEYDTGAVGGPGEVLHALGRVGELPRLAAVGVNHPHLPGLARLPAAQEGQQGAVGREARGAVGDALGELALHAVSPGQHQPRAVLGHAARAVDPRLRIDHSLAVGRHRRIGQGLQFVHQVGGHTHSNPPNRRHGSRVIFGYYMKKL